MILLFSAKNGGLKVIAGNLTEQDLLSNNDGSLDFLLKDSAGKLYQLTASPNQDSLRLRKSVAVFQALNRPLAVTVNDQSL